MTDALNGWLVLPEGCIRVSEVASITKRTGHCHGTQIHKSERGSGRRYVFITNTPYDIVQMLLARALEPSMQVKPVIPVYITVATKGDGRVRLNVEAIQHIEYDALDAQTRIWTKNKVFPFCVQATYQEVVRLIKRATAIAMRVPTPKIERKRHIRRIITADQIRLMGSNCTIDMLKDMCKLMEDTIRDESGIDQPILDQKIIITILDGTDL